MLFFYVRYKRHSMAEAKKVIEEGLITLTAGDAAENHKGMEQIGKLRAKGAGFHEADLDVVRIDMMLLGVKADIVCLVAEAGIEDEKEELDAKVLVIKGGVDALLRKSYTKKKKAGIEVPDAPYTQIDMFNEQVALAYDKKAFMYGRVVNKHARWNLCFDDESRGADYAKGMGTIVGYNEVPIMKDYLNVFEKMFGAKAAGLKIESNYYYDPTKTGIGFHGDSERRIVIAGRLGHAEMPMHFQWFHKGSPIGKRVIIPLEPGDMYIMSEKAVGTDWKMKNIPTLRHATGAKKYTDI